MSLKCAHGQPHSGKSVYCHSCQGKPEQLTVQQFPATNLLEYLDLKQVILQQVSHTPEQHHQHFHALAISEIGCLFIFAQQL